MPSLPYDPSRRIGEQELDRNHYGTGLLVQMIGSLVVVTAISVASERFLEGNALNGIVILLLAPTLYTTGLAQSRSDSYMRNVAALYLFSVAAGSLVRALAWLTGAGLVKLMVTDIVGIAAMYIADRCGLLEGFKRNSDWALRARAVATVLGGCVLLAGIAGLLVDGGVPYFTSLLFGLVVGLWTGYSFVMGLSLDPTRLNVAKVTAALYADVIRQPYDAYRWRRDK